MVVRAVAAEGDDALEAPLHMLLGSRVRGGTGWGGVGCVRGGTGWGGVRWNCLRRWVRRGCVEGSGKGFEGSGGMGCACPALPFMLPRQSRGGVAVLTGKAEAVSDCEWVRGCGVLGCQCKHARI